MFIKGVTVSNGSPQLLVINQKSNLNLGRGGCFFGVLYFNAILCLR